MRRRIISPAKLDRPRVVRIVAVLAAGTLVAGVAAWLAGERWDDDRRPARPVAAISSDPLHAELHRCNDLGQSALNEPACRAAWAENRRRFFAPAERRPLAPKQEARP